MAAVVSLAGGPWSTRRRLCSGSIKRPIVKVMGSEDLVDDIEKAVLSEALMEMLLTRLVSARSNIEVVRLIEENVDDGESISLSSGGAGRDILQSDKSYARSNRAEIS